MVRIALSLLCTMLYFTSAHAQKNVALVIGNDNYSNAGLLHNAGRDARLLTQTLLKARFTVVGGRPFIDKTKVEMDQAVNQFAYASQNADVALFYFSGHGMQIGSTNYLMPTDAGNAPLHAVGLQNLNADLVMQVMAGSKARLKILLLDACRNNPYLQGRLRSGGLAPMQAPAGTLIGFATQPGALASDGLAGTNSPYAKALAQYMSVPGLELFAMFNEVGLAVMTETRREQQPWISASPIEGRFYFVPPSPAVIASVSTAPTPPVVAQGGGATPAPIQPVPAAKIVSNGAALGYIQQAYRQLWNNDYLGARQTLTEGLKYDKLSAPAYAYRGFATYLQGLVGSADNPQRSRLMYREAFPDMDLAIALDPSYPNPRRHRGNTIVATYHALTVLKQPVNNILDRAVDDLRAAENLEPDNKITAHNLGMAYLVRREYTRALEQFGGVIERWPAYVAPYSARCMTYRLRGDMYRANIDATHAASKDSRLRNKPCLTMNIGDFWRFSMLNL